MVAIYVDVGLFATLSAMPLQHHLGSAAAVKRLLMAFPRGFPLRGDISITSSIRAAIGTETGAVLIALMTSVWWMG